MTKFKLTRNKSERKMLTRRKMCAVYITNFFRAEVLQNN